MVSSLHVLNYMAKFRRNLESVEQLEAMAATENKIESATYSDILGTDIVDICVGSERRHFSVHKKLICTKVPYFKRMFTGLFKEGQEQAASLPEDDADAFNLFVEWLYMDRFRPLDFSKHCLASGPIFDRVKLYCFADKLCLHALTDYTMSVLLAAYVKYERFPSAEAAQYTFENTSSGSHLRTYMAGSVYYLIKTGTEEKNPIENLYNAMAANADLGNLVVRMFRSPPTSYVNPKEIPWCRLHNHENKCLFPDSKSLGVV